jgi:acyl-CoA hydrolase
MAANVRKAVAEGRSDCVPIFLSEIPLLFHRKIVKPDVTFIQVSMIIVVMFFCLKRGPFMCPDFICNV